MTPQHTDGAFMKPSKILFASLLSTILFISGCQNTPKNNTLSPAEQTQLKMLVSIVAGAKVLKNQCNKIEVPNDDKLIQSVIKAAKDRGWDVDAYAAPVNGGLSKLQLANDTVYRQLSTELLADPDSLGDRCEELNAMLSEFIAVANKN